ncbi:hypothetical protein ACOME3_007771 [Neoechinorhynchus agilis]
MALIANTVPMKCLNGLVRPLVRATHTVPQFELNTLKPFVPHRLHEIPDDSCILNKSRALKMYEDMVTIRRMENTAATLYREKLIRGFLHLCVGQEAMYVGVKEAITSDDAVIGTYRCHGWGYVMGVPPDEILCELTGSARGCSKGKGGSMHIYNLDTNFLGGNGITGAQVPLGAGLAFANKYRNKAGVALTFYGDGASNQGQVFEAYNFAMLNHLPVIFVCENNGFGMFTSASRSSANTKYYKRGDLIPGLWVDGMDVVAVKQAVEFGRTWCLANHSPLVMEMAIYRFVGHSVTDPGNYRSKSEVDDYKKKNDPVVTFKQRIIYANGATDEDFDKIDDRVKGVISKAESAARNSAKPDVKELGTDIYSTKSHNLYASAPDPKLDVSYSL